MTGANHERWTRRGVLSTTVALSCGLAGCGSSGGQDGNGSGPTTETAEKQQSEQVMAIESRVEELYERLASLPIARDGKFTFDVSAFEDDFDHKAISDRAGDITADVGRLDDAGEITTERAETLTTLARLADDRASQRYLLHQTIAAILAYARRVRETRYQAAIEPIEFARKKVDESSTLGQRVKTLQERLSGGDVTVDGYRHEKVQEEQTVLLEATVWLSPITEGLHRLDRGYVVLEEANRRLDREEAIAASEQYREANRRFEAASESFKKARSHGRRIGYVAPIVEEARCSVSGLVEGTDTLAEAIKAIENGDERRGKSLARKAIDGMEQQRNRCS
jgi:hypothetical protein